MTPMLLVIDTSIQGASLALVSPDSVAGRPDLLWRDTHPENMGAVAAISTLAARGLAFAGLKPSDLSGIAVSVGPGSFTGIKVGLAFAAGFKAATATDIPMVGLSALDAAASHLASDGLGGALALFLPATRTHGYLAVAGARTSPAALVAVDSSLSSQINALPDDARILVAGRWPLLTGLLRDLGRSATERPPPDVCEAAIYGMAERATTAWPTEYSQAVPEPRYLRLSTAEERRAIQMEGLQP